VPKTIFGTSEKSNFILNMKPASVEKLGTVGLVAAVILPLVSGMIVSIADKIPVIIAIGTYVSGFACLLFFLINALRGDVSIKKSLSFWSIAILAVLAFVSYYSVVLKPFKGLIREMNYHGTLTPLIGEYGRYEGLFVLFCYFGIALLALCIKSPETVSKVFTAFLIAGAVGGIFAVLQHIPGLGFPNAYRDLPTYAYNNVYISSGTTDNPIFYGGFVTLIFGMCAAAAVFLKKHRLIFATVALLSFTTGLFTSSLTSLIGSGAVIVILVIIAIIKQLSETKAFKEAQTDKKSKKSRKTVSAPGAYISAAVAIAFAAACIFLIVFFTQGIWIRDKYIAALDGVMRKMLVGSTGVNTDSLYDLSWSGALDIIAERPLFGVGPDGFAAFHNMAANTFDTAYNDFLFTAATRGIPSLIVYIVLVIAAVVSLIKNFKNPYAPVVLTALCAYLIQSFFNSSAVTVSPMFWLLVGLSFAPVLKSEKSN
jgi:O-antigen ligase